MSFKEAILPFSEEPLSHQILFSLLKEYRRPYDKINELVKAGVLVSLKNGFYVVGPGIKAPKAEPFLIANHLFGPSYISLDSALSYWKLIPEKVVETNSVTIKRSKIYNTPIGRFRYIHAPQPYYSFGVTSISLTPKQVALMASAEKALCDKIAFTTGIRLRSRNDVMQFLTEDLRIEKEFLRNLNVQQMKLWIKDAPKKSSIDTVIETLEKL